MIITFRGGGNALYCARADLRGMEAAKAMKSPISGVGLAHPRDLVRMKTNEHFWDRCLARKPFQADEAIRFSTPKLTSTSTSNRSSSANVRTLRYSTKLSLTLLGLSPDYPSRR